ncbi:hypothetical protein [Candidatus Leptofilum sp.]
MDRHMVRLFAGAGCALHQQHPHILPPHSFISRLQSWMVFKKLIA